MPNDLAHHRLRVSIEAAERQALTEAAELDVGDMKARFARMARDLAARVFHMKLERQPRSPGEFLREVGQCARPVLVPVSICTTGWRPATPRTRTARGRISAPA
jgi:hypothetical protein